jgi:hypothetical protein
MESSGYIDVVTLPLTGTYTILVDPEEHAVGAVTLTLYDVPPDFTGTTTPGGAPVTVTTTTPGQNASVTFSGVAGQRITVRGTSGAWTPITGCDVWVQIRKPDNSPIGSEVCMESSGVINAVTLPSSGTYTVWIDPEDHAVGSVTLAVEVVP